MKKINNLIVIAIFFLLILFVYFFVSQEKTIYFWDWSTYWLKYQQLAELAKKDLFQTLQLLGRSINYDDYNFLPIVPLLPFYSFIGHSRLFYILSIVIAYSFPTLLFFPKIIRVKKEVFLIPFLIIALFPQLWTPILMGQPDIIGVLLIFIVFHLYFKYPILLKKKAPMGIIGFILALLIITRRWYAYWALTFFIAILVDNLIFLSHKKNRSIKYIYIICKNLISSIFIFTFSLAVIGGKFVNKLFVNYSEIYSAYKTSNTLLIPILLFIKYFGILTVLVFVIGTLNLLKDYKIRRYIIFVLGQAIAIFVLFAHTQNFSRQHYYLIIPAILIVISLFIVKLYFSLDTKIKKIVFCTIFTIVLTLNFFLVFVPSQPISFLFPQTKYYPLKRTDLEEIDRILQLMNTLLSKNDYFYVLSSSFIMNDSILKNACSSQKNRYAYCNNILQTYGVDKKDGFPIHFFSAKYILITDPVGYHLRPNNQKVIGILADQIYKKKGIGQYYEKLPYVFILMQNTKVYIYQKTKPLNKQEIEKLLKIVRYYNIPLKNN